MEYGKSVQPNENLLMKEKENVQLDDKELPLAENTSMESSISISTDISNTYDNTTLSEDILKNSTWKIGQLAWARMSIYPFWPCMITHDPSALMTFQKVQSIGKAKTHVIHVHFFNDNGRHSWVPAHHMIPFNGIEDFRKRASLVTDIIRKKEPKFAAALCVKPNIFGTWQKAVAEAMDVLYELDLTSLEKFKPQLKDLTNNDTKRKTALKRKRKEETPKTAKKMKINDSNLEFKPTTNVNEAEIESNLNLETPPVSPPNEDNLRTQTLQKQKRITKMINKLQPPDFEVYFERNFYTIKEQHSDTTDEQVREYLYDVWENMAPEEKIKYRATYRIENNS